MQTTLTQANKLAFGFLTIETRFQYQMKIALLEQQLRESELSLKETYETITIQNTQLQLYKKTIEYLQNKIFYLVNLLTDLNPLA